MTKTINAYNQTAAQTAAKHLQMTPTRIFELCHAFFSKEGVTADIGCGSGRDSNYLIENGFEVKSYDASEGMLKEAKRLFPNQEYGLSTLPELKEIEDSSFSNILCSAVLMHIPEDSLVLACINLLRVMKVNGKMILSFRNSTSNDKFEDGKLYESINPNKLGLLFQSLGGKVLFQETTADPDRDGIQWHTLVVEKEDLTTKNGIYKLQEIITRDKKTSTYKLALIRSLCHMAKYESHLAYWDQQTESVWVPIKRVAACWIKYYWHFIHGEIKQTTHQQIAFKNSVKDLSYKESDLSLLISDIESGITSKELLTALKKSAETIKLGPIKHAGGGDNPVFSFYGPKHEDFKLFEYTFPGEHELGMIHVPQEIWKDLINFNHWIEDSLVIEWARLTKQINKDENFAKYLEILISDYEDKRTTEEIRKLYKGKKVECVWTGKQITNFEVDHVIPYSVWSNNDLWNLLPASKETNREKTDKIPTIELIKSSRHRVIAYWEEYKKEFPERFNFQIKKALGVTDPENFQDQAILGLIEVCERLALMRGLERY